MGPYGCSYALLKNPKGIKVKYFINHCWKEPVLYFFAQLTVVFQVLGAGNVWVCFLANPQTWTKEEMHKLLNPSLGPMFTPFALALKTAQFLISVTNENVCLYTRLWCVFERV